VNKPISLADGLPGLNLRSRFAEIAKLAHARRHRVDRRWRLHAQIAPLEERCMLSVDLGGIALPTPSGGFVQPGQVMSQMNIQANKTITIHNNTDKPIFPIIEDANTGQNPDNNGAYYDPYDTPAQEYRLYAGYSEKVDGKEEDFLGIPAGASITLTLPMVFWDAGTIQVVEDTPSTRQRFLAPFNPGGDALGRPFLYNSSDAEEAVVSATLTGKAKAKAKGLRLSQAQGMELLYTTTDSASKGIISDAPSQLLEFTIRDQSMPASPGMNFTNSVDYDISYINNLYLPVAMEADKAGVGYVGTLDDITTFETAVKAFESGKVLDGYFDGKGWPYYNTSDPAAPVDKAALIKLVGAQNIFGDNSAASSYNLLATMLSSSAGNQASGGVLPATNDDYAERDIADLWFGWLEYYSKTSGTPITGNLLKLLQQTQIPVQPVAITPDPNTTWMTASGKVSDTQFANAFAYTVYQVMNAFSNAPTIVFNNNAQPALRTFMQAIIGNTISTVADAKSPAGVLLTQEEVALLQGEPNTDVQVLAPGQPNYSLPDGKDGYPYPAPAGPSAPAKDFAVGKYNLDPFVWFVHKYLGAYSYAFSVDDRFGNVMVDDATGFTIAVGGPDGISDKKPFGQ
jgi:hypothetical protein